MCDWLNNLVMKTWELNFTEGGLQERYLTLSAT